MITEVKGHYPIYSKHTFGRMRNLAALSLEPRPSRFLLIGGGIGHLLAGAAVVVSSVPLWVKAGFVAGIVLSLAWVGYRYGYRYGHGFVALVELFEGRWRLETGRGATCRAELISGYAHPVIVILDFRLESGRRRSLTLLPDSADPDALRRLRVWLRTQRDDAELDRS